MKRHHLPAKPFDSVKPIYARSSIFGSLVIATSLLSGCEASQPTDENIGSNEQSIVGGKPARGRDYPWMVALFEVWNGHQEFMCGGTLIDATHVLTAAHCSVSAELDDDLHMFVTSPTTPANVVVARRPASLSALENKDYLAVHNVVVHPQYDEGSSDYDVAVWELAAPIRLAEYPQLMTNPVVVDWLSALHLPVRVIGYGALSEEATEASDILRQVDVPLVSREQCRDDYAQEWPDIPPEEIITDRMVCAGPRRGGKDSCYGDSGGPLFVPTPGRPPLLAGVVSWGAVCAAPKLPGVYANVAALADYVQDCQAGKCETRAPQRECDWGYLDCDGEAANGCEALPATPERCGAGCDAGPCGTSEACIIGDEFYCTTAKPVTPGVTCVFKEPDSFGEYTVWFSLLSENEGSIQIPLSDQHLTNGAQPFFTMDVIPSGLTEFATLAILERPDAGSYTVTGPDGQARTATVTADTPDCETLAGQSEEAPTDATLAHGKSARDLGGLAARPNMHRTWTPRRAGASRGQ
ncbi:MAG: serine protease [Myxococcales bacterium]